MHIKISGAIGKQYAGTTATLYADGKIVATKPVDPEGYFEFNNLSLIGYVVSTAAGLATADCRKGSVLRIKEFRPLPTKPHDGEAPPTSPAVKAAIKLDKPYAGRVVLVENQTIDASAVPRVVELEQNQTVTFRNCRIINATSFIEGATSGSTIRLENVVCEQTKRYGLYLESKARDGVPIFAVPTNRVHLLNCVFGSSTDETPVRLMFGVSAIIEKTVVMDTIDLHSDKANQGLRLHCFDALLVDSTFGRWTKLGWGSDLDRTHFTRTITAKNCTFSGGVRLEGLLRLDIDGGLLDGRAGASGYAIGAGKGYGLPEVYAVRNAVLTGKYDPAILK